MDKIGNYYYLQNSTYNFTPVELSDIKNETRIFTSLLNEEKIQIKQNIYREIGLEQIHLERIGFKNSSFEGVYCFPIFMTLGSNLQNLARHFFGYFICKIEDVTDVQNRKNRLEKIVNDKYVEDENYLFPNDYLRAEFGSIFTVNELFKELEGYGFEINNKKEVITG